MKTFIEYLTEVRSTENDHKLLHLTHLEDLHIDHGDDGFKHATAELNRVRKHVESGKSDSSLLTKIDGCVHEDTKITTNFGTKTIKEICESKEDIKVLGYDFKTNKSTMTDVTGTSINIGTKPWVKLILEDLTEIILTEDHEVFTTNRGWCKAGDLTPEDNIKEKLLN